MRSAAKAFSDLAAATATSNDIAITADGKRLAVAGIDNIMLWDVAQVLAQNANK